MFDFFRRMKPAQKSNRQKAASRKLRLEVLEDRVVPSTALNFTSVQEGEPSVYDDTIGWQFTPTKELTVTKVGAYDFGGDGLVEPHQIGIWNSSGTLLAQATISGGEYANHFWYVNISPLVLQAGQDYSIGENYFAHHLDEITGSPVGLTADSITLKGSRYQIGSGLLWPTTIGGSNVPAYIGPNFQFTADGTNITPTTLAWNTDQGGVDVGYKVAGSDLAQDTTMAFYWSSSARFADRLGGPIDGASTDIPAGTAVGDYGPFHVDTATLGTPPDGATHLLAVTDPDNVLGNFSESNNVVSLSLTAISPTSLTWNKTQGGVDFSYQVGTAPVSKDTAIGFYWATGPTFADALEPLEQPVYVQAVPAGTAIGDYGPFQVDPALLRGAPVGASYLLVVADPNQSVANADTANNTLALRDIAAQLRDSGRIAFAHSHISGVGDSATALQNILDAANGYLAHRSSYGNAPGGTVFLDQRMLDGMLQLASAYTFRVTEIAGGSHTPNSRHYVGLAFDVDVIDDLAVTRRNPDLRAFMQLGRDLGATEVLGPGRRGHDRHVHFAWPRV